LPFWKSQPKPKNFHTARAGYGYSSDPFGRWWHRNRSIGQLVAAVSGTRIAADNNDDGKRDGSGRTEAVNDPYESDQQVDWEVILFSTR